jgi:hypothetical protein
MMVRINRRPSSTHLEPHPSHRLQGCGGGFGSFSGFIKRINAIPELQFPTLATFFEDGKENRLRCPLPNPVVHYSRLFLLFISAKIAFCIRRGKSLSASDESGCSDQPAHGKVVSLAGDVVVEGQPTFLRSLGSAFWRGPGDWPQPG